MSSAGPAASLPLTTAHRPQPDTRDQPSNKRVVSLRSATCFEDCFNLLLQLSAGVRRAENDWNALLVRFWVQHGPAAAPRTVRRGERDAGLVVEGSSGGPWRKQAAEALGTGVVGSAVCCGWRQAVQGLLADGPYPSAPPPVRGANLAVSLRRHP